MIASIEAAWPGQAVEESNLTVPVAALRPELGKAPGGARWIETLPRRGYRFVDPIDTRDRNAIATASSAPEDLGATIARHDPTHAARRKQNPNDTSLTLICPPGSGLRPKDLRDAIGAYWHCVADTMGSAAARSVAHQQRGTRLFRLSGGARGRCRAGGPSRAGTALAPNAGLSYCAAVSAFRQGR